MISILKAIAALGFGALLGSGVAGGCFFYFHPNGEPVSAFKAAIIVGGLIGAGIGQVLERIRLPQPFTTYWSRLFQLVSLDGQISDEQRAFAIKEAQAIYLRKLGLRRTAELSLANLQAAPVNQHNLDDDDFEGGDGDDSDDDDGEHA